MANYGPPDGTTGEPWRNRRPEDAYGRPERGWREAGQASGPDHGTYQPGYDDPPRHDAPHAGSAGYGSSGYGGSQGYGGSPAYGSSPGQGGSQRYGPEPYRPAYQPWNGPPEGPDDDYPTGPAGYGGDPVPPARPSRGRGPLIAVLAAVVLLVLGGGAGVLWLLDRDDAAPPAAPAAAGSSASAGEESPAPSVAAPESSADPRFAKVGQCVRNEGPAGGKPKLLISECAPKSYEVLHRVDGPTTGEKDAAAKCAQVDGYTNWYFFDSELDTLDFVLCLKQR